MTIRKADEEKDYEGIWNIFSKVISTGDTYVFDPNTPKEALHRYWFAEYMDTFVVVNEEDVIVGTYFIKPNQIDLGNHVANCGYMISPEYQGKGIGSLLCEHSIGFAKLKGYSGIQFNMVVSTNTQAVRLWKKFGFRIIGTIPKGFRHSNLGLVDTYIMFREL
jgi:GNAT superfamily N-acetyltransferase